MRGRLLTSALSGLVLLTLLAACGDDDSETGPCVGLADRWATIQQGYLDRLGDADTAELDRGSARVDDAAEWFGPAMIEQVRDAQGVGCADEFQAGSVLLCARIDRLEPGGEAAEQAVAYLASSCGDE